MAKFETFRVPTERTPSGGYKCQGCGAVKKTASEIQAHKATCPLWKTYKRSMMLSAGVRPYGEYEKSILEALKKVSAAKKGRWATPAEIQAYMPRPEWKIPLAALDTLVRADVAEVRDPSAPKAQRVYRPADWGEDYPPWD